MPDITLEINEAAPVVLNFGYGVTAFDVESWIADLPEYASNEDAVTALGADQIYCASAEHQAAARGTLMRTF